MDKIPINNVPERLPCNPHDQKSASAIAPIPVLLLRFAITLRFFIDHPVNLFKQLSKGFRHQAGPLQKVHTFKPCRAQLRPHRDQADPFPQLGRVSRKLAEMCKISVPCNIGRAGILLYCPFSTLGFKHLAGLPIFVEFVFSVPVLELRTLLWRERIQASLCWKDGSCGGGRPCSCGSSSCGGGGGCALLRLLRLRQRRT